MIVCLGTTPVLQRSMVFERLQPNEVNRAAAVHDYASGKSINVARVLHTLGEPAVALGFAGGARGAEMLADVSAARIPHHFVDVPAPTRQCVTVIDRAAGAATELVEESRPVHPEHAHRLLAVLLREIGAATGCVLSGSLPPNWHPDFYLRCLRLIPAGSVPVMLDARGDALRSALPHGHFIAKMNREELAQTVGANPGDGAALVRAMRSILPAGGAAVVTLGAGGVVACDVARAWRVHSPRVDARSAVGSGDAFAAGAVARLARGDPLDRACAYGAACGAANAITDRAGHLSREDVEKIMPQVRVEAL
jgi:tagatose 6-phosphate kinase